MIRAAWTVRVARPAERVFDVLADLTRESEWNPDASNAVRTSPGPIGAGSVWEQDFRRAGHVVSVIDEYEPPSRLSFASSGPSIDARVFYELTPHGDATEVSCRLELTLKGWRRLLEPIQGPSYRRRLERARGPHLKRALER